MTALEILGSELSVIASVSHHPPYLEGASTRPKVAMVRRSVSSRTSRRCTVDGIGDRVDTVKLVVSVVGINGSVEPEIPIRSISFSDGSEAATMRVPRWSNELTRVKTRPRERSVTISGRDRTAPHKFSGLRHL